MFRKYVPWTLGTVALMAGLLVAPSSAQATRVQGLNVRADQNGTNINFGQVLADDPSIKFAYDMTNDGLSMLSFQNDLASAQNAGLKVGVWAKAEFSSQESRANVEAQAQTEADLMYTKAIAADPHIFDPGNLLPAFFVVSGGGGYKSTIGTLAFLDEFKADSGGIVPMVITNTNSQSPGTTYGDRYLHGIADVNGVELKDINDYNPTTNNSQTGAPDTGVFQNWQAWWYNYGPPLGNENDSADHVVVNGSNLSSITIPGSLNTSSLASEPEPASLALLGVGAVALWVDRRRRRCVG